LGELILIEGVLVDLDSILSIDHTCAQDKCDRHSCCCSKYEIGITGAEMSTMIGFMGDAAKYSKSLKDKNGEFINVFDKWEEDLYFIDSAKNSLCAFAYENKENQIFCSLHSAALETGTAPHKIKPKSCSLWPLAIIEQKPQILTIQEDVFDYQCNIKKTKDGTICPSISETIENLFGNRFRNKLNIFCKGQYDIPVFSRQ
jgi:uncharacterized protein DUF3109